ncbi:MAG: 50S ribosomal protein L35 [Lachnospiraceae bacterium]|nr:50S ribosomal protein L35 [Lachnospiraceae bacterium]
MPKMKTSRSAAKRFKLTGTGKLKRNKAYKRHILTKKSTKKKRELRHPAMTDKTNVKNMMAILPYLK